MIKFIDWVRFILYKIFNKIPQRIKTTVEMEMLGKQLSCGEGAVEEIEDCLRALS